MNRNRTILLIFFIIVSLAGCNKSKRVSDIPVIDLSKDYPERKFTIQELAEDIDYVALETSDSVLFDRRGKVVYVSEERIIAMNPQQGDVFVFGRDGKIISIFNHKGRGPTEYSNLAQLVYDARNREIFVYAAYINKITVYSETGKYRRHFNAPEKSEMVLYDFDEETLLGYDKLITSDGFRTKPYLFLSKTDGNIVAELNWEFKKRYSGRLNVKYVDKEGKERVKYIILGFSNNWNNGNNFVIGEMASDTIFQLTRDKKFIPLLARIPSVHKHGVRIFLTPILKTDKFILMGKIIVNLEQIESDFESGLKSFTGSRLWYDFTNGEIYVPQIDNEDCSYSHSFDSDIVIAKNMGTDLISADYLVGQREAGKLTGKLKEIAETLVEDDNPVLMIVKFMQHSTN
jgi:hypothetical protein